MFVVDTNILVYAANEDSPWCSPCRRALEGWRRQEGAWFTTWGIIYEYLRVVTHRRVFRRPLTAADAWQAVQALLASPGFGLLVATPRHPAVAAEVIRDVPGIAGNLAHDAHTAILMREHGIRRIYTRDLDFHRFPFLEVLDPTQRAPRAGEKAERYRPARARRASGARGF